MRPADHYRGADAAGYDAHRRNGPEWAAEQAAVAEMVTDGPVIDVPVGTGRFLNIYREKGLQATGVDISDDMISIARDVGGGNALQVGTIFGLPFADRTFATAVCSRLLNWLEPENMARAITELRRVARCIVVSIRTGREGDVGNYTHDLAKFYGVIDGLFIAERSTISKVASGTLEMFKLRTPTIDDVWAQSQWVGFHWVTKLARDWTEYFHLPEVDWSHVTVRAEYWTHDRLKALLHDMAEVKVIRGVLTEMFTDEPPQRNSGPLTIMRLPDREIMLDGRRRANLWMRQPGRYPVLVVEPC